ncbi:MAG: HIT domain-containing protein [Candidatus Omnitrophica bacterium]|nr:HIT domain-containing protein [Candidatus Omnitrophota bacterium]
MKRLWAPWRIGYILQPKAVNGRGCLFCRLRRPRSGAKELVLTRGTFAYSVLNRYPYNNGHLLVVPYRHVGALSRLTQEEWLDLWRLTLDGMERMRKVLRPQGYNVGFNLGRAAGAGIPGHLHLHLVPRWAGDVNFMPVLADHRVVSQSLDTAHRLLARAFPLRSPARPKRRA